MMSSLQAAAAQAFDIPTPFAILDKDPINPDLEPRSSDRISSQYSLDDLYDESDPGLGENMPPGCASPTEEVESSEEEIREIDPKTAEIYRQLDAIMARDKQEEQMTYADINTHAMPSGSPAPDLMDITFNSRPQQVDESSSSDSEMEHPLDYKPEFNYSYISDDDDSDDDLVIPTPRPTLKLKPAIVKKQSPKRKPATNTKKFWVQLQEFKQELASRPNQYCNYDTTNYYVATPQKTTKSCSICKQQANPIQHMQAVTWWGDKRKYFDVIDSVPAVDACSTCFDTWVGHHKDSAKKGFLECTNGKTTHILRAPVVQDFFGLPAKSQSLYVQVRN